MEVSHLMEGEKHPETGFSDERGLFVITGVMASGKSTIAELLASRLGRGVHLRGDVFRRMIVSGREEMLPDATAEAERQLLLRYRIAADAAERYLAAGFGVVLQDVILGPMLSRFVEMIVSRPVHVVVLTPSKEVVAQREAARPKKGYGIWTVDQLDHLLRHETPKIGLWIDSSGQAPLETVEQILLRRNEARI